MAVVAGRVPPAVVGEETDAVSIPASVFSPVDRVLRGGFLVAAAAVAIQTLAHLANALLFDYGHWNLDATGDGNALSWASSVATFGAALGAFLLSVLPETPTRRFVVLGSIFVFFSLDDVVGIHEGFVIHSPGFLGVPDIAARSVWPLVYLPLFGFSVLTLWRLAARVPDRIRMPIVVGLVLFVVSFLAEGIATLWWTSGGDERFLVDDVEVAIEEGAELAGWILVATAFCAILFYRCAPRPEIADEHP